MALSKEVFIDEITAKANGVILFREVTRILEDGEQIAQTYHRSSLAPASDLVGVPENVVAICNVAWTPAVVEAYQASLVKE